MVNLLFSTTLRTWLHSRISGQMSKQNLKYQKVVFFLIDKNKLITTSYNVFYTDIKAYKALQDDEKNETENSSAVPNF